jgi:glycine/D-amino acid oxidase-like deaminating enzyme
MISRIVICGGGTIGAAIAYFTSRRGGRPILMNVTRLAQPRNRGFLALDGAAAPGRSIGGEASGDRTLPSRQLGDIGV